MQTPHLQTSQVHFAPLPVPRRGFKNSTNHPNIHKPDATHLPAPSRETSSFRKTWESLTRSPPPPMFFFRGKMLGHVREILLASWWSGRHVYAENVLLWIKVNKTKLTSVFIFHTAGVSNSPTPPPHPRLAGKAPGDGTTHSCSFVGTLPPQPVSS